MTKYLIKFSYDGSCFNGYQRQKNLKTVQGEIEKVLTKINNNEKVELTSASRTDKGVHAKGQVAHFNLDVKITLYGLKKVLNKALNGEIYIKEVKKASDNFHARYDVLSKTYSYYINIGEYNPIERNYIYQYNKNLDIDKMKDASKILLGEHDFRGFTFQSKEKINTIREIHSIDIEEKNQILKISLNGSGFLRKMVRNIVGVLIEIGEEKKSKEEIIKILNGKGIYHNKKTVLGCGLYLEDIFYKEE